MSNFEIYKKTLKLSLVRMLISFASLLLIFALPVVVFLITNGNDMVCLISTGVAFLVGCIVSGLISHFITHLLKAGQIAMMAEGIATGALPDNVYAAAKAAVKQRFVTVSAFYVIERLIKGITHQITNGVTKLTNTIAGNDKNSTANTIAGVINLIISIVMHYVCACSMAWVFIHPKENAFKLVCDGAVVYFQNWKALLKNVFLVLLICAISLVIICAPLTMGIHGLLAGQSGMNEMVVTVTDIANTVMAETAEEGKEPVQLDAAEMLWIICGALALCIWGVVHSALVDPYIQVTVLAVYLKAAFENPPKVDIYEKLCGISKKFTKAFKRSGEPQTI